jgi:hypothetical protein
MSDFHRSDHADTWSAKSFAHPPVAAAWEAATAAASGLAVVRSVSTPTNLLNS